MSILEPTVNKKQINGVTVVGTTFSSDSQWYQDETMLIDTVCNQIYKSFPVGKNLLINLTWFGPQFANSAYTDLHNYVGIYQRVFFLASVDSAMMTQYQLQEIVDYLKIDQCHYLGNFETPQQFTFISSLLPKYFKEYKETDLLLQTPKWIYVTYNRKPRQHRVDLINKLIESNLCNHGQISLGAPDPIYSDSTMQFLIDKTVDYSIAGNWNMDNRYGIAHDIHSLGNMEIWVNHLLHIVGETEFFPWDPMFITEKTWKPIIGMRPFVINGQSKIYQYLRNNGFKTFNHYWPQIPLDSGTDIDTHDHILEVIKYLTTMSVSQLTDMFNHMLPDLRHNRARFFEFSQEQQHKINHIFE